MPASLTDWISSLAQPRSGRLFPLTAFFLALSVLLSLAFVAYRNTYDDEYSNLPYVSMSVPRVIHAANSSDVHPPGMYLLTNFAYRAIPSPRWMVLCDLVLLYAGVATFLFALAPLFPTPSSRVCFLLLASLHPQLLMWGNTIRWYGWWTGVALITLVVALRPGGEPRFGYGRAALLGLLLTCLFYLNYITLVFGVALGATLLFRYSWRAWKQFLVTAAVFAPLIAPQIHPFLAVHIPGGGGQRTSIALSLARMVEALFCSEAYLPWHPLAILAFVVFVAILSYGIFCAYRQARASSLPAALLTDNQGLASFVLFSMLFFCLVVAAGFGSKPRNGLLLIPLMAVPFALMVAQFRSARLQALVLLFLALWSGVGIEHLIRREGLTKSNMNNHPEELVTYIRQAQGADCSVVVTYDQLMALTISTSNLARTLLLSPMPSPVPLHDQPFSLGACPQVDLYRVKSYLGGMGAGGKLVSDEMSAASTSSPVETLHLSLDPDAARKRKLTFISGATDLPDYRYIVTLDQLTPLAFEAVERKLPHYVTADGQPMPMLGSSTERVAK